jgi:GNAT superfamily N-acetyltransferase
MYSFRKALASDKEKIWEILQFAIQRRKEEGSKQWQDGYPNLNVIESDIEKDEGFVLTDGNTIVGYAAVIINNEPEYEKIVGKWLTNDDFVVVHRIAIAENYLGKNVSKIILKHIEDFAINNTIFSIKVDTNFDNFAMLRIFEKLDYTYCGEVYFRGSPRKAFEKILSITL